MPGSRYSTAKFLTAVACVRAAANDHEEIAELLRMAIWPSATPLLRPDVSDVQEKGADFGLCAHPLSQRPAHCESIFRLLLKIAVRLPRSCDSFQFLQGFGPNSGSKTGGATLQRN